MKVGTLLIRALLVTLLVAGAAQWWVLRQAELAAQRFVAQWQAYGTLRYDRLWVNLWGSASLYGVSFEPAGLTQALLGTPLGYRFSAREVYLHDPGFNRRGELTHLRLHIRDLNLPMDDGYRLRARNAPPSLASMGYRRLLLQSDLEWQLLDVGPEVRVLGDAEGVDSGRLDFDLQLQTTPAAFRNAPDQVGLQRLQLDYRDHGLMARYLNRRADELQLRREATPAALVALLDQRAKKEKWRWDAASAEALRGFIRHPEQGFDAVLEPPGQVRLRDLNLYAVGDWAPLLGFRLQPAPPR